VLPIPLGLWLVEGQAREAPDEEQPRGGAIGPQPREGAQQRVDTFDRMDEAEEAD
jgi:hypothetical protein